MFSSNYFEYSCNNKRFFCINTTKEIMKTRYFDLIFLRQHQRFGRNTTIHTQNDREIRIFFKPIVDKFPYSCEISPFSLHSFLYIIKFADLLYIQVSDTQTKIPNIFTKQVIWDGNLENTVIGDRNLIGKSTQPHQT